MIKSKDFPAIGSLIISAIIALFIISWPIYFFGFSTVKIIEMEPAALIYFTTIEIVLIGVLIGQWVLHKRVF